LPTLIRHAPLALGHCVRCFVKKPATTVSELVFMGVEYQFPLCEQHADMLTTQMFGWTRVGKVVDTAVEAMDADLRAARVPVVMSRVVEHVENDEPAVWQETLPQGVRELLADIPGIREWRMTRKAQARLKEDGIDVATVLLTAVAPESTKPSTQDEDVSLHSRGNVTAVVNPGTRTIISVHRQKEFARGYKAS
jgi:hypothetical protein